MLYDSQSSQRFFLDIVIVERIFRTAGLPFPIYFQEQGPGKLLECDCSWGALNRAPLSISDVKAVGRLDVPKPMWDDSQVVGKCFWNSNLDLMKE